jgi:multiple sugar transport system ATP-binding protein
MAGLVLDGVAKSFGRTSVLHGIDLDIADGEFVVVVGPSGCGKSTLLRLIAGLEDITAGELRIGAERVNELPPARRGVAMVFQSYALYPHMTAYENIAFGLKLAGEGRRGIAERVRRAAGMLGITALLDRRPRELSGGQRQRVAIGRAIVRDPQVFLFDEPLSNLDASMRTQMRAEIARLQHRLGVTTVYVTHDQVEAMTLADRLVVLNAGRVEQVGRPLDVYAHPATRFVAGFIGVPQMNFLAVGIERVDDGVAACRLPGGHLLAIPVGPAAAPGTRATLGVRPEHLAVGAADGLPARVDLVEELGDTHHLHLVIGEGEGAGASAGEPMIAKLPGSAAVRPGATLRVAISAEDAHLFDGSGVAIADRRRAAGTRTP